MKPDRDTLIHLYRVMVQARFFEEKVQSLGEQKKVPGSYHLCIGEEGVLGACVALEKRDQVANSYRGHGQVIAKGGDPRRMLAEILGKVTGYCRGRGGTTHLAHLEIGCIGSNGIVGAQVPLTTGVALAAKYRKTGHVCLCFFGDGASNQGVVFESLNMASIWKLPVIYFCVNNMYAISTAAKDVVAGSIAGRAEAFGIPGIEVDGNNVVAAYQAVREAAQRARDGEGATLIEAKTYRTVGHWQGDPNVYRTEEEIEFWRNKDPIKRHRDLLVKEKVLSEQELDDINEELKSLIDNAEEYAMNSPEPEPDTFLEDIFSE